jgi:hypothetical protein
MFWVRRARCNLKDTKRILPFYSIISFLSFFLSLSLPLSVLALPSSSTRTLHLFYFVSLIWVKAWKLIFNCSHELFSSVLGNQKMHSCHCVCRLKLLNI